MKRVTPKKAIDVECKDCMGGIQNYKTPGCQSPMCYLSPFNDETVGWSYLKKISTHCQHCTPDEKVDMCEVEKCKLYPYRYGKNPRRVEAGKKKDMTHLKQFQFTALSKPKRT